MGETLKRNSRLILIVVIALIVVVFAVSMIVRGKAGNSKKVAAAPAPALTVNVVQSSQASWDEKLSLSGPLAAWQEAVVSAEVSGLAIAGVLVDVGSEVKRGQSLALLSQDSVLAELRRQEATVAQVKASLAEATANADRARKIRDSGALSEQQITQYLVGEETAKANLAAATAQLESQSIRLRQTSINAIDDGVISSRTATLGSVVSAGSELFRLVRKGRIEWRAEVSAQQLSLVRPGQKATVALPDGSSVVGVVRIAAPTLDATSRNALIYVDLPSRNGVRAGMYARGEIFVGKRAATILPQNCVVQRDGRSYVFELAQDAMQGKAGEQVRHVIQHVVTTGRRVGNMVEIVSGLPQGASVVSTGAAFLNDGDIVRVVTAASGQASAPLAEEPASNSVSPIGNLPALVAAEAVPDVTAQSGAR